MNNSSPETTEAGAKAILGPMTLRDALAAAGALLILVGSLIPILMVGGYFSNLWMLPGGFFYPLITLVLPIVVGGAFTWRRFAGRTALRVGSQTLDQIGSVIGLLGTGYFFFAVVATFTPAFLVALIGSVALLAATTLAPFIKPFAADFAPGQGHLLTRDVLPTVAATAATQAQAPAPAPAAESTPPAFATFPVAPAAAAASPAVGVPLAKQAVPVVELDEFDAVEEPEPFEESAVVDNKTEAAEAVVAMRTPAPVAEVMEGNIVPVGLYVEDDAELADIVDAPKQGEESPVNPAIARLAAAAAATSAAAAQTAEPVGRYEQPAATETVSEAAETPAVEAPAAEAIDAVEPENPAADPVEDVAVATAPDPAEKATVAEAPVAEAPVVEAPVQSAPATSAQPLVSGPAPTAAFSRIDLEEKLSQEPAQPEAFGATHAGDSRPQAFWFAVMESRTVYNEATGAPAFQIHPGGWVLAMEDRGAEFLVQDADGKQGVLRDLDDIERG